LGLWLPVNGKAGLALLLTVVIEILSTPHVWNLCTATIKQLIGFAFGPEQRSGERLLFPPNQADICAPICCQINYTS
jgi:hypothetical protein